MGTYVKTKPATIDCEDCGAVVPVKQGRGRKPRFCADCKAPWSVDDAPAAPVAVQARSLADHPALLARQAKNGPGRAAAHRPLGIKATSTAGRVPKRGGAA